MGSLLPDSNSSNGLRLPFSPILFDRNTEKTAAASVDDTIAPIRNPSIKVKSEIAATK
ncbi:MAG: hypothetical protein BWY67_02515 [Bacteroidetes bacterium ADurb.Bin397]|nr:MAG: hypothetical protein BWY67_02515 [Bacteroidetes bacterium ADurb.Bin397]